jgi:hypothetical protein
MQEANKFTEDLIKELALEFHRAMNFMSTEFGKQITDLRTEVGKNLDDLKLELKFDMNQMETRLNHRIDDVSTGLGGKIDRIDKELTSFRKDTNGQFHEVRATLLRLDEKSSSHDERLTSLERAVNTRSA